MKKDLISVILPVYNAECWLHKCLDSLIEQTLFDKMELIIVNDGSTDESAQIMDDYSKQYENIQCIHILNGGVSNARNIGLDNCNGEYIAFVDADDYFDRNFIENLYRAMDEECDISCSGFIAEYSNKNIKRCADKEYVFSNKESIYQFLIADSLDPNVTDKLFRRNIVLKEKFDKNISLAEDQWFLFKCLKRVRKIKIIPFANYHYLMNDSSACRGKFSYKKFDTIFVANHICNEIKMIYPEYMDLAESMVIDVKCRVYGEMYYTKSNTIFKDEYIKLKTAIKKFNIKKKYENSSTKHFLSFLGARIHPALYCFFKMNMKLQYKN